MLVLLLDLLHDQRGFEVLDAAGGGQGQGEVEVYGRAGGLAQVAVSIGADRAM